MSNKPNLAALLAKARAAKEAAQNAEAQKDVFITNVTQQLASELNINSAVSSSENHTNTATTTVDIDSAVTTDKHGNVIQYNAEQLAFIKLATSGQDCILLGAAGTGKTTCQKGVINSLIKSGRIPVLPEDLVHKHIRGGTPGIVITSFTRRAVSNIKKNVSADMQGNCITIHKLLEYAPVYYETIDEETGLPRKTMAFEPSRNTLNPLPPEIKVVVIEESSMVSTELFEKLEAALPHKPQYIFLGDIQQLPPTFGMAILGFKFTELESNVIELTQVYRQALESPIIALAHRILSGKEILPEQFAEYTRTTDSGEVILHPWKKKLKDEVACLTAAAFLKQALDAGQYNPETDMILCPFNKSFGTVELNKHIAQHLAKKRGATVYEVIAGYNKHYFSVGDRILFDKEDGIITDIKKNPGYYGKTPKKASPTLDYWGYEHDVVANANTAADAAFDLDNVDAILAMAAGEEEDKVNKASHVITVQLFDSDRIIPVDAAAGINSMLLSYSLTVHKSQGSEWDKVFLLLHQSHATMLQRELLYTAVTRAKKQLYIICEPEALKGGITSQRIKGNTLKEKIEFFKEKTTSQLPFNPTEE